MPAPLSYADPSLGSIDVALMRFAAREPTGRQLWYLAGGPGGAGTSLLPLLHRRYQAAWHGADFYTLDHRGTGGTVRLSCPAQEAPGSPGDRLIAPREVEPCVEHLQREHGEALPHLTLGNSARDLGAAIDAVGDDATVLLWGNSYGTHWAQRFLQQFPESVEGVFLEALVPADASYRNFDYWMNDAGMRLMQRCADDSSCAGRFSSDPMQLTHALPARLAQGHCAALTLPVPVSWVLGSFLYDHQLRGMLPLLVHMLDRCSEADIRRIQGMYAMLFADRGMLTAGDFSAPAHVHVILSELWTGDPPDGRTLEGIASECLFCPADRAALDRARAVWPTYPPEPSRDRPADYHGPLWMLQGGLDPAIPPQIAAGMGQRFSEAHQHYIPFPTGAHTLTGKTPAPKADCAIELLHAFVEDPRQAPPLRCVDEVEPPPFTLGATRLTEALLGEGDPWSL